MGVDRLVPGLFQRAGEIFGGFPELAHHLRVPEHSVHLWALGKARAPAHIVVMLVDLVLQDDIARAREDRRHEPRATARGAHHSKESARAQ